MRGMSCFSMTASSMPRRPSRPPCTRGCSVLTRPSMISGKPVYVETSVTGMPASASRRAVPPVLSNSTLRAARARAKSTSPVLSETDSRALRIVTSIERQDSGRKAELSELLTQCSPVDPENGSGTALIARGVIEHRLEQGFFDLAQHEVVQVRRLVAVQVGKIIGERAFGMVTQRHFERAVATGIFSRP